MIPIATHVYKGCIIGRGTRAMKYECYCNGRFISADTLAGMRQLITATLTE